MSTSSKVWNVILADDAVKSAIGKKMMPQIIKALKVLATTPNPMSHADKFGYVKALRTKPLFALKPHTRLRNADPSTWEFRVVFKLVVDGQETDDEAEVCVHADTKTLEVVAVGPRCDVYKGVK